MRLLLCLCLVYLVSCQVVQTNDSTELKEICTKAPVSNLGLCNNTCSQCAANGYTCTSCPPQFTLSNGLCNPNNEIHNYTIYRYLNALNDKIMASDAKNFELSSSGERLTIENVIGICQNNSYQYFMLGLFKATDQIILSYDYTDSIDQIQIKFNLISVVADMTVLVDINDNTVYTNTFNIFSDLTGTYALTTGEPNYLSLSALSTNSVNSIITQIDTGVQNIISKKLTIRIYVDSKSTLNYVWGFSDVVVIQRACETCVSTAVLDLIISVGTVAWIIAVILAVLVICLFVMLKMEKIKRKLDFQNKLGSSSNNLPIKAINRVADSLQKSVRTMQKQFRKEDIKYEKLMKQKPL